MNQFIVQIFKLYVLNKIAIGFKQKSNSGTVTSGRPDKQYSQHLFPV